MSTNIPDAFISKLKPHELIEKLVDKRELYLGLCYANYFNDILEEALSSYDLENIPETSPFHHIKDSDFDSFLSQSISNYNEYAKKDIFCPDARLSIGIYPMKYKTLLTVHGSHSLVKYFVDNEKDWLIDHSYWDSTDKPDDVSKSRWERRKKDWDKVFDNYSTRVESMFTYDFVGDVWKDIPRFLGIIMRKADINNIKMPDDLKRKGNILLNRLLVNVDNDKVFSKVYNIKKEIKEGVYDDEISTITLKPINGKFIDYINKKRNEEKN